MGSPSVFHCLFFFFQLIVGFLNIFQKSNLVGHNLIQYLHLTLASYFRNLPTVMGDCKNVICKSKLREFFLLLGMNIILKAIYFLIFLQLQINRSYYYSYAADSLVYKLLRKFGFCLKLTAWFLEITYTACSDVL